MHFEGVKYTIDYILEGRCETNSTPCWAESNKSTHLDKKCFSTRFKNLNRRGKRNNLNLNINKAKIN